MAENNAANTTISEKIEKQSIHTADLKSVFWAMDTHIAIDEQHKRNTLEILRREIAVKEVRLVNDRRKIWQNHLRYADRTMMILHLSGCVFMLLLIAVMHLNRIDNKVMTLASMILSGALGFLSILEVGKICFAELSELSETCYFNVTQMSAFHMISSGIMNLAMLFFAILFVSVQWKMRLIQIGLYMLVPFFFTQCVCLGILLTETGRRNIWLTAAAGVFLSVFYTVLASTPRLYTQSALLIWGIALAVFSTLFCIQVKTLFTEISKGEILCTNWN